jgi:hypothetical protein
MQHLLQRLLTMPSPQDVAPWSLVRRSLTSFKCQPWSPYVTHLSQPQGTAKGPKNLASLKEATLAPWSRVRNCSTSFKFQPWSPDVTSFSHPQGGPRYPEELVPLSLVRNRLKEATLAPWSRVRNCLTFFKCQPWSPDVTSFSHPQENAKQLVVKNLNNDLL